MQLQLASQQPPKISQQPTQQRPKISQQLPKISQQPWKLLQQHSQQAPQQPSQQEDWLCGWIWLPLSTWQEVLAGGLHEEEMGTTNEEEVGGT